MIELHWFSSKFDFAASPKGQRGCDGAYFCCRQQFLQPVEVEPREPERSVSVTRIGDTADKQFVRLNGDLQSTFPFSFSSRFVIPHCSVSRVVRRSN